MIAPNKALIAAAMALFCLLSPNSASAQARVSDEFQIVVVGQRLEETAAALAQCIATNCPPEEDIRLSLAHAENQFLEGEYDASARTLNDSLDRNRQYGDSLPVPVSNLYRADSRIARHRGEPLRYTNSTLHMRDVLKSGLGKDDPRTMVAELAVGESRELDGYHRESGRKYRMIYRRASSNGHNRLASYAKFRSLLLEWRSLSSRASRSDKRRILGQLEDIRDDPVAGAEEFSLAAAVMLAEYARGNGDESATDALMERFASQGGVTSPILLRATPLPRLTLDEEPIDPRAEPKVIQRSAAPSEYGKWADLGFWIDANGAVTDVQVLRSKGAGNWLEIVQQHLLERKYAPLKSSEDGITPSLFMIERYTLTADNRWSKFKKMREPSLSIRRLDITPDNIEQPDL